MSKSSAENKDLIWIVLAFFSIYIIWGSTYLWNKIMLTELPPFSMAGWRFVTASLLIFLFCFLTKTSVKISKPQAKNTFVSGLLFLTLGNGGVVWALQYIDSGFASLMVSAQPLVLIVLLYILEKKKIRNKSIIGVVLGMLGIYLLVSQNAIVSTDQQWLGVLILFGCLLCWGYGSIFVAKSDLPANYLLNTAYQMLFGGSMMVIVGLLLSEKYPDLFTLSTQIYVCFVLLVLFGSIAAFTSFNYLLKKVSPEKVATSTYVNPIVAMILGSYFLDELITQRSILAAATLLLGVYFINSAKSKALVEASEN